MVQERAISMKFLTHRVSPESTDNFSQILFAAIFGDHLEFLRKPQKRIYLGNGAISTKFLTHWESAMSTDHFSPQKNSTILGGHLEFLRKMHLSW